MSLCIVSFLMFISFFFFFNDTATTEIYTLSLHDALPIYPSGGLDLALGTHETLRHRRFGHQEGSCDLLGRQAAEQFPSTRFAAESVDGSLAGGRRDPAACVRRQALGRPLAQGDGERLLHGVLGEVDVTEDPDQGGHRPAGLLAEDPADLGLVDR